MKCDYDGMPLSKGERCPSCALYNAAITAVNAAAAEIATTYDRTARDAWMNGHGVFAWVGESTALVGSPEQAAPFMALLDATRAVTSFKRPAPRKVPRSPIARGLARQAKRATQRQSADK